MQQLETNAKEMDQISEELTAHENSMEDEYEAFTDSLNNKRRNQSEQNAKDALKNAKSVDEARKLAQEKEKAEKARALANASEPQKILQNIKTKLNAGVAGQLMPSLAESTSKNISMSVTLESHQLPNKNLSKTTSNLTNIQDFQPGPGEEDFDQFLDNSGGGFSKAMTGKSVDGMGGNRKIDREDDKENASEEEDDEDDTSFGFSSSRTGGNPMVANFKETIDSEDDDNQSSVNRRHTTISTNSETKNKSKANRFLDLSDEENERIEDKNELATVPMIQNQSASSSLAPLVPTVLEGSKAKAADSLPHSNSVSLQQFDLSSHDFDFLESITSKVASMPTKEDSVPSLSGVSSSNKKSSSKKKSSRSTGLLEETLDENETAPVKKKSSKSKSKSKDSEKREKKERKEKKSKSSAAGILEDAEERDSNIDIKQDLDYEEI